MNTRNISYDTGCGTTEQYTQVSLKKQESVKVVLTSVEELSAGGPAVFVSEGTFEACKNKDTCVSTDNNQPWLGM